MPIISYYGKCSKFSNTFIFLFSNKVLVLDLDPQKPCQNSKQERPILDYFFRSSLIWVCPVCLDLFGWQLNPLFSTAQPRKTRPNMTEKTVDWDVKNQIKTSRQLVFKILENLL